MTNRIEQIFQTLKTQNRKALITYAMAGDPDEKTSLEVFHALASHADILEIGMPFSDPMADGPVIQAAGLRALEGGMSVTRTLSIVQQFRSKNNNTPIVLMGYFNPIMAYGIEKFMNDCKDLGVDGLIVVDIPPEEADEIVPKAQQNGLCFIRLVTPTTDATRLQVILKDAGGFLYYVSIAGITGTASADPLTVGTHIARIKQATPLPVVAGFGIKTPDDARAMAAVADGVVVGSSLVQTVADQKDSPAALIKKISDQVRELARALEK